MNAYLSLWSQCFPPQPRFHASTHVPDLTGKVVIVTGANTGLGKETVKELLLHNAKVYIAARNKAKCESAIQDLKNSTGKAAVFLKIDLGNLKSVKAAAEEFLSKETRLDVLINNAGVMVPPVSSLTSDGYDLQFGTNVLGHYYFTKLLLPLLISTAKGSPDGKARIVTVSSCAHTLGFLNFKALEDTSTRQKFSSFELYAQSKYGNVVLASELDRRYRGDGIISISVNPGNAYSELLRHVGSKSRRLLKLFLHETSLGALTQLYAATSPDAAELGGKYLVPWARIGKPRQDALNPKLGQALWKWCGEQIKDV